MHELILYATPTGPLADACASYFERVASTTAQTYPPHVTLTGFFRRSETNADAVVELADKMIADLGPLDDSLVIVERLTTKPDWVGLEVRAPRLIDFATSFAVQAPCGGGEDAVRLKDWLHLSLAYGIDDLTEHAALALRDIDPSADAGWELGLWERTRDGTWLLLTGASR